MDSKSSANSQVKPIKTADLLDIYNVSNQTISRIKSHAVNGKLDLQLVEYRTTRGDSRLGIADTPENHKKIGEWVKKGRKSINKRFRK